MDTQCLASALPRTDGAASGWLLILGIIVFAILFAKLRRKGLPALVVVALGAGLVCLVAVPPRAQAQSETCTASISGSTWWDADADGVQDPAESPVTGIGVILTNQAGDILSEVSVDQSGHYIFDRLRAGSYRVVFPDTVSGGRVGEGDNQADSEAGVGGRSLLIVLAIGEAREDVNLGYVPGAATPTSTPTPSPTSTPTSTSTPSPTSTTSPSDSASPSASSTASASPSVSEAPPVNMYSSVLSSIRRVFPFETANFMMDICNEGPATATYTDTSRIGIQLVLAQPDAVDWTLPDIDDLASGGFSAPFDVSPSGFSVYYTGSIERATCVSLPPVRYFVKDPSLDSIQVDSYILPGYPNNIAGDGRETAIVPISPL